jgi:hypothetical protein
MKWEKLGKIFDPSEHELANGYSTFAKSPQALVFEDFIRIYFCTQKKTENGKYVSCPHYADFDKDLRRCRGVSSKPVIELGGLGCFDEHGIFPMNILRHEHRILAFTTGWSRRTSVSIEMEIGFAESFDGGKSFSKLGLLGPIMSPTPNEPCLVGDGFVRFYDNLFHMWYIFGKEWRRASELDEPDRSYRIAYSRSLDGINWERDGRYIIPVKSDNECQALPTVFTKNGRHHMYFCYRDTFDFRNNKDKSYKLGYAFSLDGITWLRQDDAAGIDESFGEWDSDMTCYPHVFEFEGKHFLLYNGNEFGKHGFGAAILVDT